MKNKIQRYLAGEREGFSLVELIIVIAIMAILVGVVALAVLPNIAKSRESKDISALDSVLSALNSAVASKQVSKDGQFEATVTNGEVNIKGAAVGDSDSTTSTAVRDEVCTLLGKEKITLSSAQGSTASKLLCKWTVTGTTIEIRVALENSSGNVVQSKYNDTVTAEAKADEAEASKYGFVVTN